ncbi:MAG: carboxypeptidase regulatory-like domain-containing protein [Planctomycetes bacterium]|nr:carboxypeptidase regulatory-like domain-containing protein [Planctomycetota bacterium]
MNEKLLLRSVCAWAILTAAFGCGSKNPATVEVTGTVTFNGAAVEGAQVTFFGEQGRPAAGVADDQGRFRLMTFAPGDGALAGEYEVVITKTEAPSEDPNRPYAPVRSLLPERYSNRASSGLRASVRPDEKNDFAFELTD